MRVIGRSSGGALVAAAVLLLVACGSTDPSGSGPASTQGSASATVATVPPATRPLAANGRTESFTVPGTKSGFTGRPTFVYLPPIYDADPSVRLPVVLMLGGIPGGADDWFTAGQLVTMADAFAAQNGGRAPILVQSDFSGDGTNDTQCTDGPKGNAETYLTVDVMGALRDRYRVDASKGAGIGGLSAGAFCAQMLPLRHPDLFSVYASYSSLSEPALDPPGNALQVLFGGDQAKYDAYDPVKILAAKRFPGLAGWYETGEQDPETLAATKKVVPEAQKAGIATCLLLRPGIHEYQFWVDSFVHSLPWIAHRLGVGPVPDTGAAVCSG